LDSSTTSRLSEAAASIVAAERSVRVLRSIAWPSRAKEEFLAGGARELPRISYPTFTEGEVVSRTLARARSVISGDTPEEAWLRRQADSIEGAARMLAALGTPAFFEHSRALYGEPSRTAADGRATPLALARSVDDLFRGVAEIDLGAPAPACHLASAVADGIRAAVTKRFGQDAPEVVVVDDLSANALAGPRTIRIRRGACFTDKDLHQLLHHEAFVHVCTSLNGRRQTRLPILGASHAGTTRTQEGLAVFAEFISGSMEPQRFRRLADRVLAVQMAIDGADFLDVYRFFLERVHDADQAFENARRVFRGGVLEGGAPFTKDVVYLDGLLRVMNFLRVAVAEGRADCLLLLFCGKLDVEDVPVLARLVQAGMCDLPRYLPPWMEDRRFLVSYLTLSRFLNSVDLQPVRAHYAELLRQAPRLTLNESTPRPVRV
jgi:uncharacterized protein (TIGR02421 family)